MMEPKALLDTDILSLLMRDTPSIVARTKRYLGQHSKLTISAVTRFEILRGLKAKQAMTQLAAFEAFCSHHEVLPITDAILVHAADLYAEFYSRGQLISDADLLIAATAFEHDLVLVTNNQAHFQRISGIPIDNWRLA